MTGRNLRINQTEQHSPEHQDYGDQKE